MFTEPTQEAPAAEAVAPALAPDPRPSGSAGRGRRSVRVGSHRWPLLVMALVGAFIAFAVLTPLGAILYHSFVGPDGRFTLDWYRQTFQQQGVLLAIRDSAIVVAGSVVIAVVCGVGLAWLLHRTNVPGGRLLAFIPMLPLFLPPVVGGIAWVLLLDPRAGILNALLRRIFGGTEGPLNIYSLWGLIFTIGIYVSPYVYVVVAGAFSQYDSSLEDAARLTGASMLTVQRRIMLPIMRPAILAGFTLAFATALAEFSIPRVIGQPAGIPLVTTTIYNFLLSYPQQIESATVLSLLLVVVTLAVLWLQRRFLKVGARFVVVGGKSSAGQRVDLGRARWPALAGILAFVLATVVLPVIALLDVSFRRFWNSGLGFGQLTVHNYADVAHTSVLVQAIRNSLLFAAIGATVGMVLASLVAYIVVRTRATGRTLIDQLAALPLAVPATVLGTGMLIVFLGPPVALYGTNLLLLLGYVAHYLPQGVRTVTAGFFQVDRGVEEAAYVTGSGWLGTFRRITLPLIAPVAIGGWIFLFVLMVREVSISVLVATPNTPVIGVQIVDLAQFGNAPRLAAFSTVVLVICIVPTVLMTALGRRRGRGG